MKKHIACGYCDCSPRPFWQEVALWIISSVLGMVVAFAIVLGLFYLAVLPW